MKVIVDIKNKTLKMLENERSIFKGEYSADKLELYINKQLENEYPVITGLLSNGRRIGAFTTDDGYEMETIDGVEYTKAKFTLSKENGFPLSAGVTQITIWMYRTKDSVLVSKEAIGNVVFTVVDTTAFNDGDIIISGDVEGTVVNLKVEMENLQAKTEQYLPLNGGKPMTGDLPMKGNNIIFDNGNEETIEIGEEDNEYSMSIRMGDSDYYKGRYRASGFSIGNDYIDATLDISESKFDMSFKDGEQTSMRPDGFSVRKEGTTYYKDGEITRYPDNSHLKLVEIKLPNESGTIALDKDIPTKTSQLTNDSNYATTNQLFSKNYNELTNKPSIPTKTSQLTNNSGFITNAVNNLTNYYLKSETYTKSEVQQLLSTISSLKLEVVTNLPTTNISSNTIYLKPLDSAKENNIYEEYIYINSKWETIGTTAVDLSNYALKTDIPTKTSELTNDSNFLTKHQDISGKADKTELDNYLPYTTGTADSAKNIYWTTRLNSFQFDIESTKPSIKFDGDRVGSATITPNKIELNGNSESGTASILLDGKPVALQENIPTKLSQLEQDVESGGSSNIVYLGWVAQDLYGDEAYIELANKIKNEYGFNNEYLFTGTFNDEKCRFIAFYFDLEDCLIVENIGYDERAKVCNVSTDEDMILYYDIRHYYGAEGIEIDEFGNIHLKEKELVKCMFLERINELTLQSYKVENNSLGYTKFKTWDDYVLTIRSDGFKTTFKITLQDQSDYITEQIIKLPLMSIGYVNGDKEFKVKFYIDELGYVILDVRDINNEPYLYENNASVKYEMYHITRR